MENIPIIPAGLTTEASADEAIRELYRQLLESWNRRDGQAMAAFFAEEGHLVGFDGSTINGRPEIEDHVSRIFHDHKTPAYISIVRGVRFLASEVAILRAVTGLIAEGQNDINPDLNAIQSLVARFQNDEWKIELFQNTPAAFHGQPELRQSLSAELRQLLNP